MDDLNKMAKLHSAGAIVRHKSAFDSLQEHKHDHELPSEFIKKWVVPYYLEIGHHTDLNWINSIKGIRNEITREICLSLLGDFNWRSRLVGSYFCAVKGYADLIDLIGVHLLKSQVCCVGHIYALTLAFFNDALSISYLNKYLDYYLTKPELQFDQRHVMEAVLYLDSINNTEHFKTHIEPWGSFVKDQSDLERPRTEWLSKMILDSEGTQAAKDFLASLEKETPKEAFSTDFFEEQIAILKDF